MKRIKDLPYQQRPREKLIRSGAPSLVDAELIALLLATGTKQANAVAIAKALLRNFPLRTLPHISVQQMIETVGIGTVKAVRILAALELGERVFAPARLDRKIIVTTDDALAQVGDIAQKKQEHLLVLYLNARKELISREEVGVGNLNTALIEPKEIFAHALATPCAAIIMAHNHPSGDATPSATDIRFTRRMHKAGKLLGVALIDHLILSAGGYFSFAESH